MQGWDIIEVPDDFESISELEDFRIHHTNIFQNGVPDVFAKFKKLANFELGHMPLNEYPKVVRNMTALGKKLRLLKISESSFMECEWH